MEGQRTAADVLPHLRHLGRVYLVSNVLPAKRPMLAFSWSTDSNKGTRNTEDCNHIVVGPSRFGIEFDQQIFYVQFLYCELCKIVCVNC